jgi:shikimate kinase
LPNLFPLFGRYWIVFTDKYADAPLLLAPARDKQLLEVRATVVKQRNCVFGPSLNLGLRQSPFGGLAVPITDANKMNIYLIGYRCTGKTSVGRLLAGRIGWGFADSDAQICQMLEMSVAQIVARQGWEGFRHLEAQVMGRLCGRDATVIATGGGVVLCPESVRLMRANGVVIWLQASADTICMRLGGDAGSADQRPPLGDLDSYREVMATLADRTPLYNAAADFTVITDVLSVSEVCDRIQTRLGAGKLARWGEQKKS